MFKTKVQINRANTKKKKKKNGYIDYIILVLNSQKHCKLIIQENE